MVRFLCPVENELKIFEDVVDHLPLEDFDNDHYSTLFGFRGTAWRGKDCNDGSNTVYPGRKVPLNVAPHDDYNWYDCFFRGGESLRHRKIPNAIPVMAFLGSTPAGTTRICSVKIANSKA